MSGRRLPRPPWFLALLERHIRPELREFVTGDLAEEFRRRGSDSGLFAAYRWLVLQTLSLGLNDFLQWRRRPVLSGEPMFKEEKPSKRNLLAGFWRDGQLALRKMRRAPGPSTVVIATLGLGIGLSAVVFLLADVVLFKVLPYPEPGRLVTIDAKMLGSDWVGNSEPEFLDLEDLEGLQSVAAFSGASATLAASDVEGDVARRVSMTPATASLFSVLGVEPAVGRGFSAAEDQPGASAVAVLSHKFWRGVLGGKEDIVGSELRLGATLYQVIGVMPESFRFPSARTEVWVPLAIDRSEPWGRNNHYLGVVGRLRDGIELEGASAELQTRVAQSTSAYPEVYGDDGLQHRMRATQNVIGSDLRRPVTLVFAAVGLLLLLTCANVANIQLARGASRQRELSVRTSLGASRARLLMQLMTETLVLGFVGAVVALVIAFAGQSILPGLLPANTPRVDEMGLDFRVLLFTLSVALLTTLAFGLLPALRTTRGSLATAGSTRHRGGSSWLRSGLVIGQMAVAVLLLVGCGLVGRSLQQLSIVDTGFDASGVLVVDAAPPPTVYDSPEKVVSYYLQAEELLESVSGVETVGSVARLPLASGLDNWSIEIEGQSVGNVGEAPSARVRQVTPGYFEAFGLRLQAGRTFDERDRAGSEPVIVVNQAMAEELWPGESALDQRIRVLDDDAPFMRVVGVVESIRDADLSVEGRGEWYVPHAQAYESAYYSPREMTFVIRTATGEPLDVLPAALARLRSNDDRVALLDARDFSKVVSESLAMPRLMTVWLALFAAIAVVLGAAGLYGVLAYGVAVRRTEFGVRLSLGAEPSRILRSVLREGVVLCALGLALGIAVGIAFSRVVVSVLYNVEASDPAVLALTTAVLLFVGLAVPLAPAIKASRTDPAQALLGGD